MGVGGLWELLEPCSTAITLDALEGKRLAVDISIWLYQAKHGYNEGKGRPASKHPHLSLLLHRIAKLLFYKIRPVFVFDGDQIPPFKRQILRERSLKRHLDELTAEKEMQSQLLENLLQRQLKKAGSSSFDGEEDETSRSSVGEEEKLCLPRKRLKLRHKRLFEKEKNVFELPKLSSPKMTKAEITPGRFERPDERREVSLPVLENAQISEQIQQLKGEKDALKQERLDLRQLPHGSEEFSSLQLERLLGRSKINRSIETLEKFQTKTKLLATDPSLADKKLSVTKVVDSFLETHFLIRQSAEEKLQLPTTSKTPPDIRHTIQQTEKIQEKSSISEKEESDDDLQQAIFASLSDGGCLNPTKDADQVYALNSLSDEDEATANDTSQVNSSSSSSVKSDDFCDVVSDEECLNIVGKPHKIGGNGGNWEKPCQNGGNSDGDVIFISDEDSENPTNEKNEEGGTGGDYFLRKTNFQSNENSVDDEEPDASYADCQKLLSLLGLPYVKAPGEAEAQCVELEWLGLVDGVISDDSDVWPFGAHYVYRHMFSRRKHVQEYAAEAIAQNFGLTRVEFIQLALVAGGDYTRGLANVGPVTALELITEFVSGDQDPAKNKNNCEDKNEAFSEALQGLQRMRDILLFPPSEKESSKRLLIRKAVMSANSQEQIKMFPNVDVLKAYVSPCVDSSADRFEWGRVDFGKLAEYLADKLGLDEPTLDKMTHNAFHRWDEFQRLEAGQRQYQTRISGFMRPAASVLGQGTDEPHKGRVRAALQSLRGAKCIDGCVD